MLNETKVYSKSINIRGFQAFPVVRSKKSGGGLYIGVKHGLCESIMIDDSENADLVTIRLSRKEHGIRIILIYGPQENDLEETVSSFYHDVSVQVEAAFLNGDSIILLGDFNANLGFDVLSHDMNPMSKNGEKLFNLFCKYNLTLLNTLDFCEGTHTRIHKYKSRIEKYILDYVFVSSDLKKNVISMCIDEQKQFTPWRNLKSGKRFSDHCAIKFQLDSNVFVKEKHSKSTQVWNFNDPDGWEKFNKLTNSISMSESMWRASEHTELSYQSWKFNLNSILHRCLKRKKIVSSK